MLVTINEPNNAKAHSNTCPELNKSASCPQ